MPSKSKKVRIDQRSYYENKLNQRLSVLVERGFESGKIAKDTVVRKLKAQIRETGARLNVIIDLEKKREEMAKIKAEKAAAPKKKAGKKKKDQDKSLEISKRQQKKKGKKAKKESKDKEQK